MWLVRRKEVWSRVSMGVWVPGTPRGKCDVLGLREGVRDLYVVFALPNPVVRDAPSLGEQPHLLVHRNCLDFEFGSQIAMSAV